MKNRSKKVLYFLGLGIIVLLVVIYSLSQNVNKKPYLLSKPSTASIAPSPSVQIQNFVTTIPVKLTLTPTLSPSNTPTQTPNPCGMGKPTPVIPDSSVRLDSVSPTNGKIGDTIILKGSGFGKSSFYYSDPTKFLGGVSFYGSLCGYNSGGAPPAEQGAGWWSDNTIKVKIPGVSPGSFQIEVMSSDGKRSNRLDFQVLK